MIKATVNYAHVLRPWDGFGINYVQTAQTQNYSANPQDYGGFSTLSETDRQAILELIFGEDGLQPGLVKLFLDPWHQPQPEAEGIEDAALRNVYDHTTSTEWLRYFALHGLAITRARGGDLNMITTLYGPPGWMTMQKSLRGRDLNPAYRHACARYMISWAKYLRQVEGLPVRYISLHNEGEDFARWRDDGTSDWGGHDYNLYWPPEQVVDFLRFTRAMLDNAGLPDVAFTPGECTNWYRFSEWGYAQALANDPLALGNMGLITSHGFASLDVSNRWFGDWRSSGIDLLRAQRPELHAWVTSTSWAQMDVFFVNQIRNSIYAAKVNGLIPWAAVQRSSLWVRGDPNPGTAIRVDDHGRYRVEPGYYFYKQVSRAGQPGMGVAEVSANDSEIGMIAFARSGTPHPDAFVLLNTSKQRKTVEISVQGSGSTGFILYRTSEHEQYQPVEEMVLANNCLTYTAPPGSVTTFFGQ